MMKKVIAVLLLGCLLCLALAGCGKTDLEKSQEYMDQHPLKEKKLYSLSFCLVSEEEIDPVLLSGMQDDFNRFTEDKYNIHVVFTNVKLSDYADWLEAKLNAVEPRHEARVSAEKRASEAYKTYVEEYERKNEMKAGNAIAEYYAASAAALAASWSSAAEAAAKAETHAAEVALAFANNDKDAMATAISATYNAYEEAYEAARQAEYSSSENFGSDIRDVYPAIREDQLDLIYVTDIKMLASLVQRESLRDLTSELTKDGSDYRLLKSYMSETFFNAAKIDGKIYAVPNSRTLSDYTYTQINAEMALYMNYKDKYEVQTLDTLIKGVKAHCPQDQFPQFYKEVVDPENPDQVTWEPDVTTDLTGDYAYRYELEEDGKYWYKVTANPTYTRSDLLEGMFAIPSCAYIDNNETVLTEDDDYCPAVRLLYALDTEPELHSILHYGVKGLTYSLKTVVENGQKVTLVNKITDNQYHYDLDMKYTGNALALYPTEEEYYRCKGDVNTCILQQIGTLDGSKDDVRILKAAAVSFDPKDKETGGSATVSFPCGTEGVKVTFTATPESGYKLEGWYVTPLNGEEEKRSTDASFDYVVSDADLGEENTITVTAKFAKAN